MCFVGGFKRKPPVRRAIWAVGLPQRAEPQGGGIGVVGQEGGVQGVGHEAAWNPILGPKKRVQS